MAGPGRGLQVVRLLVAVAHSDLRVLAECQDSTDSSHSRGSAQAAAKENGHDEVVEFLQLYRNVQPSHVHLKAFSEGCAAHVCLRRSSGVAPTKGQPSIAHKCVVAPSPRAAASPSSMSALPANPASRASLGRAGLP